MTREEIKHASKDYVNYLLDKQEYHNEKYTEHDIKQVFEKGAEWADAHPNLENLWHDASERPRAKEWILIQFDKYDYTVISLNEHGVDMWFDVWCNEYNVSRWAYISDLLPKGSKK